MNELSCQTRPVQGGENIFAACANPGGSTIDKRTDVASGMWKFRDVISPEELCALAVEWKRGPDGDKYLDLHVRQCSKEQWGIGFQYVREDDSRKSHEKFFHKMTDQLKRRFGNDFIGWDVSSTTFIIN